MPRYRPETARIKAESLVKPFIRSGLNQSKVAKQLGITQQAVHQRLQRKPVQDALKRYINSPKLKRKLISVAQEGLSANKVISCNVIAPNGEEMKDANSMTKDFIDVPDHQARHKFWHDLCVAGGILNPGALIDQSTHNHFVVFRNPKAIEEDASDIKPRAESKIPELPAR